MSAIESILHQYNDTISARFPPIAYCLPFSESATSDDKQWILYVDCYVKCLLEPLICIIGFILNIMCLFVFIKIRRDHSNTNSHSQLLPYLSGLCFFDAAQLFLSFFVLDVSTWAVILQYADMEIHHWKGAQWLGAYALKYGAPVLYIVNFASIWTITAIAIERYRAICRPFQLQTCDRVKKERHSWCLVVAIFIVSTCVNAARWMETTIVEVHSYDSNQSYVEVRGTILYTNITYQLVSSIQSSII
jgi:hypothetical protein